MVFLVVGSDGTCDVHWQRALSGSFIEPLEERKVGLELPNGGRWRGPGGESCSTASVAESELGIADASHRPKIIISVTTFENGTHEGDDIYAAMLDAARFGTETEQQRITAIVENTLERVGSDDTAIKLIRSQITALSDEPGPEMIESIMARFPMLPDDASKPVERDVHNALQIEKSSFLYDLDSYAKQVSDSYSPSISLKEWWSARKAARARVLAR